MLKEESVCSLFPAMDEEKTTGTQLSVHHGTMVSGFHVLNPFKSWFWWSNRFFFLLNHHFAWKQMSRSWFLLAASPFWMWSVHFPIFDIRKNWNNSSFSLCFTFYFPGIADPEPPNNEPYSPLIDSPVIVDLPLGIRQKSSTNRKSRIHCGFSNPH